MEIKQPIITGSAIISAEVDNEIYVLMYKRQKDKDPNKEGFTFIGTRLREDKGDKVPLDTAIRHAKEVSGLVIDKGKEILLGSPILVDDPNPLDSSIAKKGNIKDGDQQNYVYSIPLGKLDKLPGPKNPDWVESAAWIPVSKVERRETESDGKKEIRYYLGSDIKDGNGNTISKNTELAHAGGMVWSNKALKLMRYPQKDVPAIWVNYKNAADKLRKEFPDVIGHSDVFPKEEMGQRAHDYHTRIQTELSASRNKNLGFGIGR